MLRVDPPPLLSDVHIKLGNDCFEMNIIGGGQEQRRFSSRKENEERQRVGGLKSLPTCLTPRCSEQLLTQGHTAPKLVTSAIAGVYILQLSLIFSILEKGLILMGTDQ